MTFVTEVSGAFDEKTGKSPLVHRELQGSSFDLHKAAGGRQRVASMIVRMSFLLSSVDRHFDCLIALSRELLRTTVSGGGKPPASRNEYIGVVGRDVYPLFSELNALLFVGKTLLDQSIGLCAITTGRGDMGWSMHSVCGAGDGKRARMRKKFQEAVGDEVFQTVLDAWKWAAELVAHRDLITHFNPMSVPMMVGLESTDGVQLNYVRIRMPRDPGHNKAFTGQLSHEKDALVYCKDTRNHLRDYLNQLMLKLANRISPTVK